ncbi:hypothetical protein DQ04_00261100 [Trypanosoma grayi]|uniref:hypothetical protein n=1 Tax=Trypanosoma grayi TaxID=71804 RepID=UPI0004F4A052|nr:hypothetical protein DQ04_00261100 [Trypanosoma grayi]KEG14911.1 hypothetical protein DQ04_00261100 [Trypanosoma grayi]
MPASLGGAVSVTSLLAKQSLSRQVIAVGLHANAASALAATTVQIGIHTCVLLQRGVTRPELSELARQQFWYDATTALTVGGASIVGGGCGAVVGGLLLPGVGTALGSLAGSLGGGFLPYMLRCTGPEVQRRRELQELSRYCETERPLQIAESDGDWLVVCDGGSCTQCVHWDTIENDNEWCVEELFRDGCSGPSRCEEEADAQRAEAWGEGGTDELAAVDHFIELIDTTMVKQTAEGIVEGNEQTLATRVALR